MHVLHAGRLPAMNTSTLSELEMSFGRVMHAG
jgi:hypothetical protein